MTTIKGPSGETRGSIIEAGDRVIIRNRQGATLGWYSKATDKTFSASGAYVGSGNQLTYLLED